MCSKTICVYRSRIECFSCRHPVLYWLRNELRQVDATLGDPALTDAIGVAFILAMIAVLIIVKY